MSTSGAMSEWMGRVASGFAVLQPSLMTFAGLLLAALFPIYCGAHASLSLPSSAAKAVPKKRKNASEADDDDDDDDQAPEDVSSSMSALHPEDALWFPLAGGLLLGGLYLLIKWLEDPSILNKVLNGYFSILGVVSVGRLIADAISVITSFYFPRRWSSRSGSWRLRRGAREFVREPGNGAINDDRQPPMTSPFPGWISQIRLFPSAHRLVWTAREALTDKYALRISSRGRSRLACRVGLNDLLGFTTSVIALAGYNLLGQPWWLVNLLGFGMSYGTLQLISPRTFWTGTMVLSSLFAYDIYMVFFTPLMVTVAKSLDVPIKLLIPRPPGLHDDPHRQALAMLGLGDVVLPGIMIALALRFDLYLSYLKKQTRRPSLKATVSDNDDDAVIERPLVTCKATYHSATGRWGERFWTPTDVTPAEPGSFPKPYFYASIVGYIVGLNTTFGVLAFSGHAQPALLYLVPSVLVAIWGLAAVKGEVKEMWEYVDSTDDDGDRRTTSNVSSGSSSSPPPKPEFKVQEHQQQQQQQPTKKMNSTTPTTTNSRCSDEVFSITLTDRHSQHSHSPFKDSSRSDAPQAIVEEIRSALDSDLNLLRSTSTSAGPRHPSLSPRLPRSSYSSPPPSSSTTATDHVHAHTDKRPRVG